jgi:hypothetical protein
MHARQPGASSGGHPSPPRLQPADPGSRLHPGDDTAGACGRDPDPAAGAYLAIRLAQIAAPPGRRSRRGGEGSRPARARPSRHGDRPPSSLDADDRLLPAGDRRGAGDAAGAGPLQRLPDDVDRGGSPRAGGVGGRLRLPRTLAGPESSARAALVAARLRVALRPARRPHDHGESGLFRGDRTAVPGSHPPRRSQHARDLRAT